MRFRDDTIDARGIEPELLLALMIAESVYVRAAEPELVITSVGDFGATVVIRSSVMDSAAMVLLLEERLLNDYRVRDEGSHIRIGYQPRSGR